MPLNVLSKSTIDKINSEYNMKQSLLLANLQRALSRNLLDPDVSEANFAEAATSMH